MQVRRKLFPYPVLNNQRIMSNYSEYIFEFNYEEDENEKEYILRKVKIETNSKYIQKLLGEGKIGLVFIVECSNTIKRHSYEIDINSTKEIRLSKSDYSGKVVVSAFAYAKENLVIVSDEFDEDYKDIEFEIDKYDILAANDGFSIKFIHEEDEDNVANSIFSIIIDRSEEEGPYRVDYAHGKKIEISLNEKDYGNYKIIYADSMYKEVFFNTLLIPALIEALNGCMNLCLNDSSVDDVEDIEDNYPWFRSIINAYKKLKGQDLTKEEFMEQTPLYWAQTLLGKPLGSALENLVKKANGIDGGEENE